MNNDWNIDFNFQQGYNYQNKLKFWSALCNEVKFNSLFYQNLKFLFKIWSKLNSPQIFLAPLILRTIFMLRKLKLVKNHERSIIGLYLSYKLLLMTFVTGSLVCPLGRRKWRTSLRESAFRLRESTNFYGTLLFTPRLQKKKSR